MKKHVTKSIQVKIIVSVAIVLMCSLGSIMFGVIKIQEKKAYKNTYKNLEIFYNTVFHANEELMLNGDMELYSNNLKNISKNKVILDIFLTDKKGIIIYSGNKAKLGQRFQFYNPSKTILKKETIYKGKPAIVIAKVLLNEKNCIECHENTGLNKPLGAFVLYRDISSLKKELFENKVLLSVIAWVLVFLIGILTFLLLKFIIIKPINEVNKRIEEIAKGGGDLLKRISITSNDEIGVLAQNVNLFLDRLKDVVVHVIQSTIKSGKSVQEVLKLTIDLSKVIPNQEKYINETGKVIENVVASINNLIEEGNNLQKTAENLQKSNKDMIEALENIDEISQNVSVEIDENISSVEELVQSIKSVDETSKDIKDFVDEVNSRFSNFINSVISVLGEIGNISNNIEQMSSLLENLSDSFNQISSDIENTGEIAKASAQNAEEGRVKTQALYNEMNKIHGTYEDIASIIDVLSKDADNIGDIVNVINEISEQTNLLALNAAIEAARAGEHGKGFSVVADEVRKLAEKTASSTKEIETLITQILDETSKAVKAVEQGKKIVEKSTIAAEETTGAIETIVKGANDTLNLVMQVVSATEKQKESVSEIQEFVRQSVETTEHISSTTSKSSEEAKEVLGQIDDVNSKFSILIDSLDEMSKSSELIFNSMARLHEASSNLLNAAKVQRAASKVELQSLQEIFNKINIVFDLLKEQENDVNKVEEVFEQLKDITNQTINSVEQVVIDMKEVGKQVSNLFGDISYFSVGGLVDQMRKVLRNMKEEVLDVIEDSVQKGIITYEDLFDRNYIPIPDTNPQKYHTRYDKFTDKYILPIEDKYQKANEHIVFVVLQDDRCYLPTHNSNYSKPLTGDYDYDLANNRTKRIFNDPVGKNCSTNTEKEFLIQSYLRDNGDILFDVSTPLFINDKHWGCIRLGFRL